MSLTSVSRIHVQEPSTGGGTYQPWRQGQVTLGTQWSASLIKSARPESMSDSVSKTGWRASEVFSAPPTHKHVYTQIHTLIHTKEFCLPPQNSPFTVRLFCLQWDQFLNSCSMMGRLSSQRLIVGRAEDPGWSEHKQALKAKPG